MNRYSKIKLINNTSKSRSIDFSDLQSFPLDTTKPINFRTPKQQTNPLKLNGSPPNLEENEEQVNTHEQKSFGAVKLSRNRSVSAAKQTNIALQTAVQRAFSMRRSSSVSERYCRIHDQCVTTSSPLNDDEGEGEEEIDHNNTMQTRSVKKKKKNKGYTSGRILKAFSTKGRPRGASRFQSGREVAQDVKGKQTRYCGECGEANHYRITCPKLGHDFKM